ncbi:hypothetical protein [Cryptosporangium phraense]|uniref:Uncharacterized protein n=1 Tax=Cryptosporangium phraense TaxID=2593070 RepID=A0A545AI58_9ACTN|nr:hypothetical protein [Cryptosporangium phraense]TQS40375.1 hypothetical protein FL583_35170 [Cryptosporangium phraense]
MTVLLLANTLAALVSVGFAVLGGVRPEALSEGDRFFAWMYAVRGVPLGVAAGLVPLFWTGPAVVVVLLAAAAAQVGDAAIGLATRKWAMIAGASVLVVVHVATAIAAR